jgi:NhaA family Na+:H+ antiporter
VYLAFQWGEAGQRGWAIPMATDIAFVVGIIALFGRRVPFGLKILLLSLAVVDDLMAVLIIAFVFTDAIMWAWLGAAAGALAVAYALNRIGVRQIGAYVVVGVFVWTAFWKSGVHPTVAGVLLGLLTPATAWIGRGALSDVLGDAWQRISDAITGQDGPAVDVERIQFVARETVSPLHRLELTLHPWVAFVIMPVFALANAGVPIAVDRLGDPIALAVAAGLAIGKPVGIMLLCAVAVRARLTTLPDGVTWGMLAGGGCLAGVGFTMALFLNALAFPGEELIALAAAGKIGTLTGSVLSGTLGAMILWLYSTPRRAPAPQERQSIP